MEIKSQTSRRPPNSGDYMQPPLQRQQNNLINLLQQPQQQELINQKSNLSDILQQQLGGNASVLQQQLLGIQSRNTGTQVSQHSAHMLQQSQQSTSNMLASQGQQSQTQAPDQQLMPQTQSQPPHLNSLSSQDNSMLKHQQMKEQQEQQTSQITQLKQQYQQLQIQLQIQQQLMQWKMKEQQQLMQWQMKEHQQLMQWQIEEQQQQLQLLHHAVKQELLAQLQTYKMPQLPKMYYMNDVKTRPEIDINPGVFHPHQQLKPAGPFPVSQPQLFQAASPQISQHSCPLVDQQNILPSLIKAGNPMQFAKSHLVDPTPSTPFTSPKPGDSEKSMSDVSSTSNAANIGDHQKGSIRAPIGTPGISDSPLQAEFSGPDGANGNALEATSGKLTVTEQPLERLIKAVKSTSSTLLSSAVNNVGSVVSMVDRIAGSTPDNGSGAAVAEDLGAMTKCHQQATNLVTQDGANITKRVQRYTSAMPLDVVSSADSITDSIKELTISEAAHRESTATSCIKKRRREPNQALLEEIKEINQRLIDSVVDIIYEDDPTAPAAEGAEGTIVKCSFSAGALSPNMKSQYASVQMSLQLLVPANYPNCSPILLDKSPVESSKNEDLTVKAKSRFSICLQNLSQPMSLMEIAWTWDVCARAAISEYAQQSGGNGASTLNIGLGRA